MKISKRELINNLSDKWISSATWLVVRAILIGIGFWGLIYIFSKLILFSFSVDYFDSVVKSEFGEILVYLLMLPVLSVFLFFKKNKKIVMGEKLNIWLLVGIAGCFFFSINPINHFENIVNGLNVNTEELFSSFTPLLILVMAIKVLLIGPVIEEIVFRKIILVKFIETGQVWIGLVVSSLLFAAIHTSIEMIFITFIFGLLLGLTFTKMGFYGALLLHMCYNLASLSTNIFRKQYWEIIHYLNFGILYWLLIICCIFLMLMLLKKFSKLERVSIH